MKLAFKEQFKSGQRNVIQKEVSQFSQIVLQPIVRSNQNKQTSRLWGQMSFLICSAREKKTVENVEK